MTGGLKKDGICVSQLDYAKRLNKNIFSLDVCAVHNNSDEMIKAYEDAGCKVIVFPDRKKNLIKYIKKLKVELRNGRYDIIHTFGSSSLMAIELMIAKKCDIKVRIAHSRNTTCDRPWLEKLIKPIFKKSYNYALACGKDAGEWLFDDKKYNILHNGKNLNKYSFNENIRKKIRRKYKIQDKIAIGHVGNFINQKNHEFLIDIFSEINRKDNNTVLFLMGSGSLVDEIKEKVIQLKLNDKVYFLGSINNVEEIIQAMDVMIFPSLFEGLPNVVIEWQASGLPCLISDKITKECCVTDNVFFLSIDNGLDEWINTTLDVCYKKNNRNNVSAKNLQLLKDNGFDIVDSVVFLEELYKSLLK